MAGEIIGEWTDARHLAIDILLRSSSRVPTRIHTPSGVKLADDADVDDAWEARNYWLMDGNGQEIAFPVRLASDTKFADLPQEEPHQEEQTGS